MFFYLALFDLRFLLFRSSLRFSEFCRYLFGEGVELRDAERPEPFEGHRPEDAGEDHDEEVADDSACIGVACAERGEGCGEARFDGEDYAEADHYLDDLGVPFCLGFKLGEFAIHYVGGDKADGAAHKGAGVFEAALVVMGVKGLVAADRPYENKKSNRENDAEGYYKGHKFIVLFVVHEDGAKNEYKRCRKNERHAYVEKGMHAEVHSREADEEYKCYTEDYPFPCGLICGDCAEGACCVLCVTRGEGIACCGLLCITDNLDGGVVYPRTGNAEEELRSLIHNGAEEACYENEIALPFIYAPEEENRHGKEEDLFAKPCDKREKCVEYRVSYLRDRVEHFN